MTTATEQVDIEPIKNATFQKISELEGLLKTNDPIMAGHLKAIHANLIQYEELAHLLSDDQIREMMKAQKQVTGSMLLKKLPAAKSPSLAKQAKAAMAGGADEL